MNGNTAKLDPGRGFGTYAWALESGPESAF